MASILRQYSTPVLKRCVAFLSGGASGVALSGASVAYLSAADNSKPFTADADVTDQWPPLPPGYTLVSAAVIHRHGDRAAISQSIGDGYSWKDYHHVWDARMPSAEDLAEMREHHPWIHTEDLFEDETPRGKLTAKGAAQLRRLGGILRERYVGAAGLLSETLAPHEITVRSTPVVRCFESAASLLLGLYPSAFRREESHIIPIVSRDSTTETMWAGWSTCEGVRDFHEAANLDFNEIHADNTELAATVEKLKHIFDFANTHKHYDHPTLGGLLGIVETLTCFSAHDIQHLIPRGQLTHSFMHEVERWRDHEYFHTYLTTDQARLSGGRFFREVAMVLDAAVVRSNNNMQVPFKLAQFSCHDTSLIPLLFNLKLMDMDKTPHWPGYAANVVLELYKKDNVTSGQNPFYVKAIYNGRPARMGSRPEMCPWEDFKELVEENGLTGAQYARACRGNKDIVPLH